MERKDFPSKDNLLAIWDTFIWDTFVLFGDIFSMENRSKFNHEAFGQQQGLIDLKSRVRRIEFVDWKTFSKKKELFQPPAVGVRTDYILTTIHKEFEVKARQILSCPLFLMCDLPYLDKLQLQQTISNHLDFLALAQKNLEREEIELKHSNHYLNQDNKTHILQFKHEIIFNLKSLNQQKLRSLKKAFTGKLFKSTNSDSRFMLTVQKDRIIINNVRPREKNNYYRQRDINV